MSGFGGQRTVNGENIRLTKKLFQCTCPADSYRLICAIRQVRIVKTHLEPKGFGTQGSRRPYPAQTNNSESQLSQAPDLFLNFYFPSQLFGFGIEREKLS